MTIEEAEQLPEFAKVRHAGRVYDFGYVGGLGCLILYEEGERNMQDAVAVLPRDVEKVTA